MDFKTFLEHFDTIADAPNGIPKLRSLILDLAVRGKLIPQYSHEISAVKLLKDIDEQRKKLIKAQVIRSRNAEPIEQAYEPYTTPTSWKWVRLCEVTHDLGQKKPDVTFSYIDVSAIDQEQGSVSSNVSILNPEDAPSRARKLVKKGTVIYSTVRPYLLNIAVINQEYEPESIVSTAFSVLHPFDGVSNWYLYYLLRSQYFTDYVERYQKGVAYPAISDTDLLQAPIPLPPFEEQIRIVEKVDELMTLCDRLQAAKQTRDTLRQKLRGSAIDSLMNAERDEELQKGWAIVRDNWVELSQSPEDVGDLRRSVLQLGIRGKLVSPNSNDEPVEVLLSQAKKDREVLLTQGKIRNQKKQLQTYEFSWEIPSHWAAIPVDSVAFSYDHLRIPVNKDERATRKGNIPYYGANGQVGWINKSLFDEDLILVVEDETFIGRTKPFSYLISGPSWVNNHAHVLKPSNAILPKFLDFVLMYYPFAPLTSGTTGRRKLTQPTLMGIKIPLPPLNEQTRIIQKIEHFWNLCDRLEESLRQSQQQAEVLAASAISHLTI